MTVTLRPAIAADCDLLFDWVNRPDSLAGKLATKGAIARPDHESWFARALEDADTILWIAESDGHAAGQVRLTRREGVHEVDIYIVPEMRKSGVASDALEQAIGSLDAPCRLRARVRPDNVPSQRLFESLDFVRSATLPDHLVYEFVIKS